MDYDIDWSRYPDAVVAQVISAECEVFENDRGLWIWRGNELVGRIALERSGDLTPAAMRQKLADLQRRIDLFRLDRITDRLS
jgi:hypothetical protein